MKKRISLISIIILISIQTISLAYSDGINRFDGIYEYIAGFIYFGVKIVRVLMVLIVIRLFQIIVVGVQWRLRKRSNNGGEKI